MSKMNYQVDESLSILSEPPDIKNWFSSYTYQSPVLDANEEFGDSPSVEEEELLYVGDSENEEDGTWRSSKRTRKMNEPIIRKRITRFFTGNCTIGSMVQNHCPTVEVPACQDSFSLTSEPPDIRNWFPSYIYESPALDTAEFDISLSREHDCGNTQELENERKEIREDLTATDVKYESLFQKEAIPNSNAAITTSTRAKYSKNNFANQVPAYSDSPSLFSEAPDFRNLFPSYVYESPSFDSSDFDVSLSNRRHIEPPDFRNLFPSYVYESPSFDSSDFDVSLSKRRHIGNIEELDEGKEEGMEGPTQKKYISKSSYLKEAIRNSDVTMSNHVEYDKKQDEVEAANLPSENLYTERTSEQRSQAEDALTLPREEQPISRLHLSSPLMTERNFTEAEIEPGWVLPKHKSRVADYKTIKTEHTKPASSENRSCLSTKKASWKIDENSPNQMEDDKSKYNINGIQACSTYNGNNAALKRGVFSEITNFCHSDEMEVAGKWRCPQRSKPVIGPPLKQLRLENWVHRKNCG